MIKILFVASCFVAVAFCATVRHSIKGTGPNCPIDDPFRRTEPFPINITLDPFANLDGGSHIKSLTVEGLSTLLYYIELDGLKLHFGIFMDKVTAYATYNADGYIDVRPLRPETLPSGNFTGQGIGNVSATYIAIKGSAILFLTETGRVQMFGLTFDEVNFQSLALDFGPNWTIGGEAVNWEELNRNIKDNFKVDWTKHRYALTNKLRQALNNNLLFNFTLQELIDFIEADDGSQC